MDTPFMKIKDACAKTGLSQHYLRKGCIDGSIPHIQSGKTYYINVPALLRMLNAVEDEQPKMPQFARSENVILKGVYNHGQ